MPRAIVRKKGKLKKLIPPVKFVPGHIAEGMFIAMEPTRPLTRKERNFVEKHLKKIAKPRGIKVTRIKDR
jgi:hypothetical protein